MSSPNSKSRELPLEAATVGLWRDAWRRLRRNPGAIVGFGFVALFVFVAIFAPLIAPYGPLDQNFSPRRKRLLPGPVGAPLVRRRRARPRRVLTGPLRRPLFTRDRSCAGFGRAHRSGLYSARSPATWAALSTRRSCASWTSCSPFPGCCFAIGLVAMLGPGLWQIMVAVGVANVPIFARLLRGSVLAQRENDFVLAARSVGVRRERSCSHTSSRTRSPR